MVYVKIIGAFWFLGFLLTFALHIMFLQMVTPGLAFTRALVWPLFVITGRPRGTPLRMD